MASSAAATVSNLAKRAVNAFATDNFTASGASGLYDRARPTYPVESVTKLLSVLGTKTGAHIVEVGAGTGIYTKCIVQNPESQSKVAKITAVEPSSGMREAFNKNSALHGGPIDVSVADGSFTDIPVPDASADIVVGAQCYHWAHPNYGPTIKEFARVLKPKGTLALIWNLEDRSTGWVAGVRDVYEEKEHGTPQYRLGWWNKAFETAEYAENFDKAERIDFKHSHPTTEQGVIDRVLSKSYITALSESEKQSVTERIKAFLDQAKDKVWIDEKEGVFEYPYETNLYLIKKKSV